MAGPALRPGASGHGRKIPCDARITGPAGSGKLRRAVASRGAAGGQRWAEISGIGICMCTRSVIRLAAGSMGEE